MADSPEQLAELLRNHFADRIDSCVVDLDEVTIEVPVANQIEVCTELHDNREFGFELMMDLCGMDYLTWGEAEWTTEDASGTGFSRGVDARTASRMGIVTESAATPVAKGGPRFAAVMQLLSIRHNQRLRVRTFAPDDGFPVVNSVIDIWRSADWFEREAFDLFGIMFEGHPDLRRILTDYGFVGHPFRKDFPLTGNVEVRYDPEKQRVVYQPVSIEPRVLVPRVIRESTRRANQPAPEAPGEAEEQAS